MILTSSSEDTHASKRATRMVPPKGGWAAVVDQVAANAEVVQAVAVAPAAPKSRVHYRQQRRPALYLTTRERQLIVGVWAGLTRREMSKHLGIGLGTVDGMLKRIWAKAGVAGREDFFRKHNAALRELPIGNAALREIA